MEYLSVCEFSKMLKIGPQTVRQAIKSGKINAMRVGKSKKAHFRIPVTEIKRLLVMHPNGSYDVE